MAFGFCTKIKDLNQKSFLKITANINFKLIFIFFKSYICWCLSLPESVHDAVQNVGECTSRLKTLERRIQLDKVALARSCLVILYHLGCSKFDFVFASDYRGFIDIRVFLTEAVVDVMNVKNLNEGDFQPVVGLDVQHVDLVAGDREAPIVLDEMSVVKIMVTKRP